MRRSGGRPSLAAGDRSAVVASICAAAPAHAPAAPDEAHDLGRLERPRAQRVQEGGRRVRQEAPRRHGQRRRRRSTTTRSSRRSARGNAPDVVSSFNSYNVGDYCGDRRLDRPRAADEAGQHQREHVPGRRRGTTRSTTACAARCRCSPTTTASTTTRRSSRQAGITSPPKTISELTADAKKLTHAQHGRHDQGRSASIRSSASTRTRRERWITPFGGKWLDAKGNSILAQRSRLDEVAEVAEEPRRLVRLQQPGALPGRRSATSSPRRNAFETGKVAMNLDGEWRVAFIQDEHPKLQLRHGADARSTTRIRSSTAPGYINGTIIGIPKTASTATRRGRSSST